MQIFGLMMVRNEADIIRVNVLHHLTHGIDHFLIVDNGSSDGTDKILQELSQTGRVQWTRDLGSFRQSEITTDLAREAFLRGADWVLPIDADEFWYAPRGSLKPVLEKSSAGALNVTIVNFVQRFDQIERSSAALLHMTRRTPEPVGPVERIRELVETRQNSFVEMVYPPKCVSRASLALEIGVGNHGVTGVSGELEQTQEIVCLHAPLRSRAVLEAQVDHGRRVAAAGNLLAWQPLRWLRLAEREGLDKEWLANSYTDDCLDVYGVKHPVVLDPRLRDVVTPWMDDSGMSRLPRRPATPSLPLKLPLDSWRDRTQSLKASLARVQQVEGRLAEDEGRLLATVACSTLVEQQPELVVQVGADECRAALLLANVVDEICPGSKLYVIDPRTDATERSDSAVGPHFAKLEQAVAEAGLADAVRTYSYKQQFSNFPHPVSLESYWNNPIGLLFISWRPGDPDIAWEFALFDAWIVSEGYVCFYPYSDEFPAVKAFVDRLPELGSYEKLSQVGNLALL